MKTLLSLFALCLALVLGSFTIPADGGYQVGDKAADFKLKNVDGKSVSLADNAKAKGYIVVFTCNTCPFAKAYESRIIALHQKYAPQGYPVVAINPNDPGVSPGDAYAKMQTLARDKKYPFPYLLDETQATARAYGATRTPHIYILTRQPAGGFNVSYIGAIDDNSEDASAVTKKYAEDALTEITAGKPASVNMTKAIGCTIKWRKA